MPNTPNQQIYDMWQQQMQQGAEMWLGMMGQSPVAPEAVPQMRQMTDQWIGFWSQLFEQTMGTEAFAQAMGKQMDATLNIVNPVKKALEQQIEQTLKAMGLPSRDQVTSLARQIVHIEEKIEGIEDQLDALLRTPATKATAAKKLLPKTKKGLKK